MTAPPPVPGPSGRAGWRTAVGVLAVAGSVLYVASDAIEAGQGGFSPPQLWLTLLGEATVPPVVLGLAAAQRPRLGRMGWSAAVAYASSFVVFAGTVVWALLDGTPDYEALRHDLGPWMTVPGVVMVVAGLTFAVATARAGVLPAWPAVALAAGVVLVALTQGAPEPVPLLAAATRALGIAGLGTALLLGTRSRPGRGRSSPAW